VYLLFCSLKQRHINTYIGQIYKSAFGSLLMLLAAESLFGASSKTGFIPPWFVFTHCDPMIAISNYTL